MLSPALLGVDGGSGDQESAGQPVGPQSDGHLGGAISPRKQQCPGSQCGRLSVDVPGTQHPLQEHVQTEQEPAQSS